MHSVDYVVVRCLSICLFVTRWYSIEMTKHIIPLISPSGSHTILVFPYEMVWQYSDGDPIIINRGIECRGYEKIQFSASLALSRK